MTDASSLAAVLSRGRWVIQPQRYVLAQVPTLEQGLALSILSRNNRFFQCVAEPQGLSVIADTSTWRELYTAFPRAKVQRTFRLIGFDLDLPDTLTGFLALAAGVLAQAQIPILAVCSFNRDYLLVREEHADQALAILQGLAPQEHTP